MALYDALSKALSSALSSVPGGKAAANTATKVLNNYASSTKSSGTSSSTYKPFDWFEDQYRSNIEGLAKYNNTDYATGKAMLISNLTGGGKYLGGGVLDYGTAGANAKKYQSEAGARSSDSYNQPGYNYYNPGVNYNYNPQYNNYEQLIKDWQTQQKNSQLTGFRAAIDSSRDNIAAQLPAIQQAAQQALNQNETDYYTKYRPQMYAALEQSGGYNGGNLAAGSQGLLTALQQNNNSVYTQQADEIGKIQEALRQLESSRAAGEQQISSGIDAQALDKLFQAAQQAQQDAQWSANFSQQQQNSAYERALAMAGLTGEINGQQTIQGKQAAAQLAQMQWQLENDKSLSPLQRQQLQAQINQLNSRAASTTSTKNELGLTTSQANSVYNSVLNDVQSSYNSLKKQLQSQGPDSYGLDPWNDSAGMTTAKEQGLREIANMVLNDPRLTNEQKSSILNQIGIPYYLIQR